MSEIISLIIHYRYLILFPLACIEGPMISFIVGMFIALGYFNPFIAYVILIFGDIIPDTAYYFLGRYGSQKEIVHRNIKKIGVSEAHFDVIKNLWHNHGKKTMFFSKLAYGLSTPFLISAGLVEMPLEKFFLYAVPVTLFQYAVLLTLGYYLSNSFNIISASFKDLQMLILAAIIIFAGYYFFTFYMRKKLLQTEKQEELEEFKKN